MQKVKVEIPYHLRQFVNDSAEVEMAAVDVAGCLHDLESSFPEMKGRLLDGEGRLRLFANIYVNGEDIRWSQGLTTPLKDGDCITIVPFIPGG
ncbi:MAG: MoaD/ThiS family protein [Chloroflexi bacterium]|nr:MoaD/ThiS family protein [Chloroflexota bacterium]